MIHHWQCARQTETNRTRVRIWFRSKPDWTSAKHFGARLELNVHFKPDAGHVIHAWLEYSLKRCGVKALKRIASGRFNSSTL
jgi:hypothetical protein